MSHVTYGEVVSHIWMSHVSCMWLYLCGDDGVMRTCHINKWVMSHGALRRPADSFSSVYVYICTSVCIYIYICIFM